MLPAPVAIRTRIRVHEIRIDVANDPRLFVEQLRVLDLSATRKGHDYLIDGAPEDAGKIGPRVSVEIRLDGTMAVFGLSGRLSGRLSVRPA